MKSLLNAQPDGETQVRSIPSPVGNSIEVQPAARAEIKLQAIPAETKEASILLYNEHFSGLQVKF